MSGVAKRVSSASDRHAALRLDQWIVVPRFVSWQHRQGEFESRYVREPEKFLNYLNDQARGILDRDTLINGQSHSVRGQLQRQSVSLLLTSLSLVAVIVRVSRCKYSNASLLELGG